jgi:hypothetical protein
MTAFFARHRTILGAALLMPCIGVLLGTVAPGRLHASTFGAVIALVIGTAIVVTMTWRHAQPVASLRQELYAIEHPAGRSSGTTWDRWTGKGDGTNDRGRALAIFWLSAAVTGLIVYRLFA